MDDNLQGQSCPVCNAMDRLRILANEDTIICLACQHQFHFQSEQSYFPQILATEDDFFGPEDDIEVIDYHTTIDIAGNIHRVEVSNYQIPYKEEVPCTFDRNSPRVGFVLHKWEAQIRNRRRLNRDIIRRARQRQEQ